MKWYWWLAIIVVILIGAGIVINNNKKKNALALANATPNSNYFNPFQLNPIVS